MTCETGTENRCTCGSSAAVPSVCAGAAQDLALRPRAGGAAEAHLVDQLRQADAHGAAPAVAAAAADVRLAAAAPCQ